MEKYNLKKWVLLIIIASLSFWTVNNFNVVFGFINKIFSVFKPFIIGGIIAFILNIPMKKIEKWLKKIIKIKGKNGIIRITAIILTLILFISIIAFMLFLLLPELASNIESLIESVPELLEEFKVFMINLLEKYPDVQDKMNELFANSDISSITSNVLNYLVNQLIGMIGGIISGFVTFFMAIVFSVYILSQKEYLQNCSKKLLHAYVKKKKAIKIEEIMQLTNKTFSNFISGQCLEAAILGVLMFVALIIFDFPYAILIAVLTAITALIPIFGALIAMVVGIILIAIQSPLEALLFIIVFQLVQQIEGNFIYPRVVGKSVGLSPMWTLLAISVGGSLFGIVGMLVSLPLASVIYALIRSDVNNKLSK